MVILNFIKITTNIINLHLNIINLEKLIYMIKDVKEFGKNVIKYIDYQI